MFATDKPQADTLATEAELDSIIRDIAASENGSPIEVDPLLDLAAKVDLLIADAGRWNEYKAASAEYVKEFTTEIRWHRCVRLGVAIFCAALVVTLITCLVLAVLWRVDLFGKDAAGHALTALIVATIGGSVIITIAVAKGAFATIADRNAGLPMPDHMKEVVDAAKGLWKS